jgi:hypothetical protein
MNLQDQIALAMFPHITRIKLLNFNECHDEKGQICEGGGAQAGDKITGDNYRAATSILREAGFSNIDIPEHGNFVAPHLADSRRGNTVTRRIFNIPTLKEAQNIKKDMEKELKSRGKKTAAWNATIRSTERT